MKRKSLFVILTLTLGCAKDVTGHRSYIFLSKEWRSRTNIFSGKKTATGVGTQKDRVHFGFNTDLKQRDCRSMFPSENVQSFSLLAVTSFSLYSLLRFISKVRALQENVLSPKSFSSETFSLSSERRSVSVDNTSGVSGASLGLLLSCLGGPYWSMSGGLDASGIKSWLRVASAESVMDTISSAG